MGNILIWAATLALMVGCAPVISSSLRQQAGPPANVTDLTSDPDKYRGRMVLLGGEVVSLESHNGGSLLMVGQQPLNRELRPMGDTGPMNTFWVQSDKRLSRQDYLPGRDVTVAGVFKGPLEGRPLVEARQIHLWEYGLSYGPMEWYFPGTMYWFTPPYYEPLLPGGRF